MFYRTAESVSPKHPDKLCDRISDAILDAYLAQDPYSRVAAETCGGHGVVFVTGEITSSGDVDIEKIVHDIAGDEVEVHTKIVKQSPEIAQGVDTFIEIGPGKTLSGFLKKISKEVKGYSIEKPEDIAKVKEALAEC